MVRGAHTQRTPQAGRRALNRIDVSVQDHTGLAATITVCLFVSGTAVSMHMWGKTILAPIRTYQPLFTILWIAISTILVVLKVFRVRGAAPLATAEQATVPGPTAGTSPAATTSADGRFLIDGTLQGLESIELRDFATFYADMSPRVTYAPVRAGLDREPRDHRHQESRRPERATAARRMLKLCP